MKKIRSCFAILPLLFLLGTAWWCMTATPVQAVGPNIPGFWRSPGGSVTPPAANALPILRGIQEGGKADIKQREKDNWLEIDQETEKVVIDWESFNIGVEVGAEFLQPNTSSTALNLIHDKNPSQIYGSLKADGKVFLVNRNGILFGPDSRINVHSLVASALNIDVDGWLNNGALNFVFEGDNPEASVINEGLIETPYYGSVYLFGPKVENRGSITSPGGAIILAAGQEAGISLDDDGKPLVNHSSDNGGGIESGSVVNTISGEMDSENGYVGMFGRVVNQNGIIRSVTAVQKSGKIVLEGTEKVATGLDSVTACPISTSNEAVHQNFHEMPGEITISGQVIEHQGRIVAPAGDIKFTGTDRIYLDGKSVIDVSGLWIDKNAEDALVEVQLNSEELTDDYGQKDGILKGATVTVHGITGSAIGDISGSLVEENQTALDRSLEGGSIYIRSDSGDIIVKQGALIDFSGGGIHYGDGYVDTTEISVGNEVHNLADVSQWSEYDKLLNGYNKKHERFGVVESYPGVFYGGSAPLHDYVSAYDEGYDAGLLELVGKNIILDGVLKGGVQCGVYQTEEESNEDGFQEVEGQIVRGREQPTGGTLFVGDDVAISDRKARDYKLENVVIADTVAPLADDFSSDPEIDPYPSDSEGKSKTLLSTDTLNAAGLDKVKIFSNTTFAIEKDADLALTSGGSFYAVARGIEHQGKITIPAGSVELKIEPNITSVSEGDEYTLPDLEHLVLKSGSVIDVRGERLDNSTAALLTGSQYSTGDIHGGSVFIRDQNYKSEGVIVESGSLITVDGGYEIEVNGAVIAGNAGVLELQGKDLDLEGKLNGLYGRSLPGGDGGTITLHTTNISVQHAGSPIDPEDEQTLFLADNAFARTGFTNIELKAFHDVTLESNAVLSPSLVKMAQPVSLGYGRNVQGHDMTVQPQYIGASGVTIIAGEKILESDEDDLEAVAVLKEDSSIRVAQQGAIIMEGPEVKINGLLSSPSGTIDLTATYHDVTIEEKGSVLAKGFNLLDIADYESTAFSSYEPLDGGTIAVAAEIGNIVLKSGSKIDVSGAQRTHALTMDREGTIKSEAVVGNAGAIAFTFAGHLTNGEKNEEDGTWKAPEGELIGRSFPGSLHGGSIIVNKAEDITGLSNFEDGLLVSNADMDWYLFGGFDELFLGSDYFIAFEDDLTASIDRMLTLDTPEIKGVADNSVALAAPYVKLTNSASVIPLVQAMPGNGTLMIESEWLSVEGSIILSGFDDVSFDVTRDLTVADSLYQVNRERGPGWEGLLHAPGNLTMTAGRIYPTSQSIFTIQADDKFTTGKSGSEVPGPVYSAGGSLTIKAGRIEHGGVIAAPMGSIELSAPGNRIYLAAGSSLTTANESMNNYGIYNDPIWQVFDKNDGTSLSDIVTLTATPKGSIELDAEEVILREGAVVDISGGGNVYAYQFLSGQTGTEDPLKKYKSFVIVPDNSIVMPGKAIYFPGNAELAPGTYSLLTEEFAFLPGAKIVYEFGKEIVAGSRFVSEEGYPVVLGYEAVMETGTHSLQPTAYVVRSAAEVMKEGTFVKAEFKTGDSGSFTMTGKSVIVDGDIEAEPMPGYQPGSLGLNAKDILITQETPPLAEDFDFDQGLEEDLVGKLLISAGKLSESDLGMVSIGNSWIDNKTLTEVFTTDSITVESGSIIEVPEVILTARDIITLADGAEIHAEGLPGTATLRAPHGEIVLEEGSILHSSHMMAFDSPKIDPAGEITIDNSALRFASDIIYIVPEGYNSEDSGLVSEDSVIEKTVGLCIDESYWRNFGSIEDLTLFSRSDIVFIGDVDFGVEGTMTIDTGEIIGESYGGGKTVSLSAKVFELLNTTEGGNETGAAGNGQLTIQAEDVYIGRGDIQITGFQNIDIASENDMVVRGEGSLTANLDTDGKFTLEAAQVSAMIYKAETAGEDIAFEMPDFHINGRNGFLRIANSSGQKGAIPLPGGNLQITARSIEHEGVIFIPAGQIQLTATGSGQDEGVFLRNNSEILARGGTFEVPLGSTGDVIAFSTPGGSVTLTSEQGVMDVAPGSLIDVSTGGNEEEGGTIILAAGEQGLALNGQMRGTGGSGGALKLDTNKVSDLFGISSIGESLESDPDEVSDSAGSSIEGDGSGLDTVEIADLSTFLDQMVLAGFTRKLDLRFRAGDAELASEVTAREFSLVTDTGSIDLYGLIDASGQSDGGIVSLQAGKDLTLHNGSTISAPGTDDGATGGRVMLATGEGAIDFSGGAVINVSGGKERKDEEGNVIIEKGQGGSIFFRALRNETANGAAMDLNGTLVGGDLAVAEAVKVYEHGGTITTSDMNSWKQETSDFMAAVNGSGYGAGLDLVDMTQEQFHFVPGVEIQSENDIVLNTNWDLTDWRYGMEKQEPGVLTLRAAGDLNIKADLVDHPTLLNDLRADSKLDSWGLNLIAGADLSSPDILAVDKGSGRFAIGKEKLVYSESGTVQFASGADSVITGPGFSQQYMIYSSLRASLGSYDGPVRGVIGGNLVLDGGVIQTATGDIDFEIAGNLKQKVVNLGGLRYMGTIRTTGEPGVVVTSSGDDEPETVETASIWDFWKYDNGGNITLEIGGDVSGGVHSISEQYSYWDAYYQDYNNADQFYREWGASYLTDVTEGLVTMAGGDLTVIAGGDFYSQAGTFGVGDLVINSGGDIDGRFVIYDGTGRMSASGSVGRKNKNMPIELFGGELTVTALDSIELGTVHNPPLANYDHQQPTYWHLDEKYEKAKISLVAATGDITFSGFSAFYKSNDPKALKLLPPSVELFAGNDILINNEFVLAPAVSGNLVMKAGGDIDGSGASSEQGSIMLSDLTPGPSDLDHQDEGFYGYKGSKSHEYGSYLNTKINDERRHSDIPVHLADEEPVVILAGEDIRNMGFFLPKESHIRAGSNIEDIYYLGQNVHLDDVSLIVAGKDLRFTYALGDSSNMNLGIEQAGPGYLIVSAVHEINLGTSDGIKSVGGAWNPFLGEKGSDLIVAAGYSLEAEPGEYEDFFGKLRLGGEEYSNLLAGETDAGTGTQSASQKVEEIRCEVIDPFLAGWKAGTGNINMTSSQISTSYGTDDIYVLTAGEFNVGKTTFFENEDDMKNTGIYTVSGGSINIFTAGDLNVNESRVMTFSGGDITVWTDQGNINAGRGSKTTVSAEPPKLTNIGSPNDPIYAYVFTPPAVGSGIRCVTFDPDGAGGPKAPPEIGDIYLFAPSGMIDAGEAGIAGRNIILGATSVANVGNIKASGQSVGVPSTSESSAGIGALAGAGNLADTGQMTEDAVLGGTQGRMSDEAAQLADAFIPKWLGVQVIGFDEI